MATLIQAIRGMNDILPVEVDLWQMVEGMFAECLAQYAYHEIRFPIVESTHLFKRTIGEVTDIVEKEMYTFADLNQDSLTLRPEGTAGCVRACLEHGLLHHLPQKLWYKGPMFRHEKPQKGRYRQFHQLGVEAFGIASFAIEVELIVIAKRLWQMLGLLPVLTLEINTLGTLEERQAYKTVLTTFLQDNAALLDEDSKRRLNTNPLRILDSKHPNIQSLLAGAPQLTEYLTEQSLAHFQALEQSLTALDIAYRINPFLVRGLDYYSHTVFEWTTTKLGSQASVCAGGRFDGLIEHLGGRAMPAAGFAIGIERLILLIKEQGTCPKKLAPSLYLMSSNAAGLNRALAIAEDLRDVFPQWRIVTHMLGGSFKSQFKKADKSQADVALIIGDDELMNQSIGIKPLRHASPQMTLPLHQLKNHLEKMFKET